MTDNTEALPPLPEQLAATFIGYVEGLLGVCLVPSHVFDAFEQRADEFRAALAQRKQVPEGWQPIETAPKDGSYFMAGNAHGVWVAHYQAVAVSGYKFDNPWRSVMLNHWHIRDKSNQYAPATHWKPLPAAPALTAAPSAQAEPVAWCALTPSGKIAHFDGKPMVMVGPVGNEHHTTPLYAAPPTAPAQTSEPAA